MEIVASGGDINEVIVCDISTGDRVATLDGHTEKVLRVCFSPCGCLLASGSSNGTIIVWDCETWTRMQTFTGHKMAITTLIFNRTGDKIVSTSRDCTTRVWNLVTNTEELKIETLFSRTAYFTTTGNAIAIPALDGVRVYDVNTARLEESFSIHQHLLIDVFQLSQDGSILALRKSNDNIILWSLSSGSVLQELIGHECMICEVCFNADASRVVSGSFDKTARIWDVSTGECLLILRGHSEWVPSCCFSEDGSKVITGGGEGSIRVWDSYTGEELRTLIGPEYIVRSISYHSSNPRSYV